MTAISGNIVRVQPRTFLKDINIFKVTSHYVRRIIWTILLLLVSQLLLTTPTFAQTPSSTSKESGPTFEVSQAIPATISPTSPLYTDLLLNNMLHSFSCLAVGQSVIGQPCLTYQITQNAQGAIQSVPVLSQVNLSGGTLGAVTSLIGGLYMNPPVRTADYLASVGQGLGIVKEAYAQVGGSGAAVLSPILKLWQVSRNVSYVIMIIIFLVIGLMIMFRNRINPQTVITAQAALPGLVIGLILITFSYFLAGLISDMAFVGTNIVGYYFSAASGQTTPQNLVEDLKDKNVLSIFSPLVGIIDKDNAANALRAIWDSFGGQAQSVLTTLAVFLTAQMTAQGTEILKAIPQVGQAIQAFLIGGVSLATAINPTAMIGIALAFIATAILLYSMFKLLLRLINNYITIIFLTITAPFQFLASALPGRQGIATAWILNMLANILAFPAVLAVLYFVAFLLGPNVEGVRNLPFQIPAKTMITGTSSFPLFGGLDLSFINLLLAFGALVALPSIPDIINRTIGRLGVAGQLIGQEIGGSIGQGRGYAGQFQSGVGTASQFGASARGLFPTTTYEAVVEKGKITGYKPSYWSYQPGGFQKGWTWLTGRLGRGGGGGGGIPRRPGEKT